MILVFKIYIYKNVLVILHPTLATANDLVIKTSLSCLLVEKLKLKGKKKDNKASHLLKSRAGPFQAPELELTHSGIPLKAVTKSSGIE